MKSYFNFSQIRYIFALGALAAATIFAFTFAPQTAQMQTQTAPRIVFDDRDGHVLSVESDGSNAVSLADGFDPSYSPNGEKIVYAYGEDAYTPDIYTMNADGSEQSRLTLNYGSYAPTFSPDGTRIVFVSTHEGEAHLYAISPDGSIPQQRLFFNAAFSSENAPVFSPDGTKIIFIAKTVEAGLSKHDYYIANIDGTGTPVRLTTQGNYNMDAATVSPDGTKILVSRTSDIYSVPTDGSGVLTNVTNTSNASESAPDFSPNGAKIVFYRNTVGLMTMNADGTNQTPLNINGDNPDWMPNDSNEIPTAPDLKVQVSSSAQNVNVGENVTVTVNVQNNGDASASAIKVSNAALVGNQSNRVTFVSSNAPGGCSFVSANSTLECQVGTLAPTQAAIVQIVVKPNFAGEMIFNSTAKEIETDRNYSDNTNSVSVQINQPSSCNVANVTSQIRVIKSSIIRNPLTGEYEQLFYAQNISNQNVDPRLKFVFDNLTDGVSIAPRSNPDRTQCAAPIGSQYVNVTAARRIWSPRQTVIFRVSFKNPLRKNISYNLRILAGANHP